MPNHILTRAEVDALMQAEAQRIREAWAEGVGRGGLRMSEKLASRLNAFTYHRPSTEVQAIMTALRERMQALATFVDGAIPECREKSLAFTALEESAMWGMKALSLTDHDGVIVDPPPAGTKD